jgi:hypothetical protein
MICTPSGLLIVASADTRRLYSVVPSTGQVEQLDTAMGEERANPACLALAPRECCLYLTDPGTRCIWRVTLPKEWFVKSAPADAVVL